MKDTYVRFRCSEDEKAMIEAMAKQKGKTMSDYMIGLAVLNFKKNIQYKQWTMIVDEAEEVVLFDGKKYTDGFEKLMKICKDEDIYMNVNDDVMDGITENNPAGKWNEDYSMWSWGQFINGSYVEFRYYI